MPSSNLDGKVAIITGSGRGIGLAAARKLADAGARVMINDLDPGAAQAAAQELGESAAAHIGDLTAPGAPEDLVASAIASFGQIDIIINNAGYTWDAPIHRMSDEQYDAIMSIHARAPFQLLRAAAPHLREAAKADVEAGREVFRKVVNVSSLAGTMGNGGQVNYSSGKAAQIGLTKSLAKEWGRLRINVNAVAFGFIETRLTRPREESDVVEREGQRIQLGVTEQARAALGGVIPLGRPGTPEEAARVIYFLCSPLSDYVHGQVINVSGGLMLGMGD
jgi:3-oxoacyl-[acyl-carrier protein] reductase